MKPEAATINLGVKHEYIWEWLEELMKTACNENR